MYDTYYTYPENHSRSRPFFLEFKRFEKDGLLNFQLFQANYIFSERGQREYLDKVCKGMKPEERDLMERINNPEGHPWNLSFEGEVWEKNLVALATEKMLKFMVDAMNDKYEKEVYPAINNAEPA